MELDERLERNTTQLVDWKNPPTVAQLKRDLREATPYHSTHVTRVNEWLRALRGQVNIRVREGRSKVQPKLIRKQNEWRYSSLEEPFLSTEDMFKITPVTAQDVEAARQNELILNKQFRVDIPRVQFINKFIRKAVDTGTVIMKLAWEEAVGVVREEQMQPVFAESPEEFQQFAQMAIQAGQLDEQSAMQLLQTGEWTQIPIGEEPVTVMVQKKCINRPVVEVKDSRGVIIDPSCEGDIRKAQFIIDRFLTDLSSLKKDGRYNEEQLAKISTGDYENRTVEDYNAELGDDHNFRFDDKPRQKLIAYEYWGFWDIHDDGVVVPIVATFVGDVMIRLEENPFPDKQLPFVVVQYLPPDTETIYGDADASLLKDNQDIIGAVTRGMIDLMGRSSNAQQGIRKDLLDPINKDRFTSGLDFEFNPVPDIEKALYVTKPPEISRSALEVIQLQNNEAEALTGVKAFNNGIQSQSLGETVGGIRSALDATAKRELGILRRLGEGLREVGRKIIAMNSVWLDDEEIIRITDNDFVAIKRDDLYGNFDLSIAISTAEADNQKSSELAYLLQTLGQTVPFDIFKIILIKIAELRKLPDLAIALQEFTPQPDPLDVAMKQAQIEAIQAQTAKDASTAPKNEADTELKLAKAGQANATARKTHSEADQADLDMVEQATGLSHERELEKTLRPLEEKSKYDEIKNRLDLQKSQLGVEKSLVDLQKAKIMADKQVNQATKPK